MLSPLSTPFVLILHINHVPYVTERIFQTHVLFFFYHTLNDYIIAKTKVLMAC